MRMLGWSFPVAAAAVLLGCRPGPAPMSEAERQAVAQDVRAQAESMLAGFRHLSAQTFLDQLANNEFYGENGVSYPTRDSLLSAVSHFPKMFTSIDVTWEGEPRITVLGPDAAVFSSRFREVAQPTTGAPVSPHGVWTGVYQRVNDRWGIVQAHESYVPEQAPGRK